MQYFPTLYFLLFQIISSTECAKMYPSHRDKSSKHFRRTDLFLFLDYQFQGRKNRPGMTLAWRKGVHTIHCKSLVALENSGCSQVRRDSENIVVFIVLERQSQSVLLCRLHITSAIHGKF